LREVRVASTAPSAPRLRYTLLVPAARCDFACGFDERASLSAATIASAPATASVTRRKSLVLFVSDSSRSCRVVRKTHQLRPAIDNAA
jgi:hypothetical protein